MRRSVRSWGTAALIGVSFSACQVNASFGGPVSPVSDPVAIVSDSAQVSSPELSETLSGTGWVSPVTLDPARLTAVPTSSGTSNLSDPGVGADAPAIPLPVAAWTGLAGLFSLAVATGRGAFRRLLVY